MAQRRRKGVALLPKNMENVVGVISGKDSSKDTAVWYAAIGKGYEKLEDAILRGVASKAMPRAGTRVSDGVEVTWEVKRGRLRTLTVRRI